MSKQGKQRWIWRVPAEAAHVNWGIAFGPPEVTVEWTVPDSNERHAGRKIQVRFTPHDARRVAAEMWRLGELAGQPARKAG